MKFHQVECHSLLRHAGGNTRVDTRDSKKQKQYIFHLNGSLMEIASIKKPATSALLYWLHADCLLKSPWFYCFRGINGHDCDRYFLEDSSPGSFIIFP